MGNPTDVIGCHLVTNNKADFELPTLNLAVALDVDDLREVENYLFLSCFRFNRCRRHLVLVFQPPWYLLWFQILR